MKCFFYWILLLCLACFSCDKYVADDSTIATEKIAFVGNWKRNFQAGAGNPHTVKYLIYQDSIHYSISGTFGNASYTIKRDTFILDNNRYIGHTEDNIHYLIFVKNYNTDSIMLYKQEVFDFGEGLRINVPNDKTTANHGWNIYHKF